MLLHVMAMTWFFPTAASPSDWDVSFDLCWRIFACRPKAGKIVLNARGSVAQF
jgi:hypothetical protein